MIKSWVMEDKKPDDQVVSVGNRVLEVKTCSSSVQIQVKDGRNWDNILLSRVQGQITVTGKAMYQRPRYLQLTQNRSTEEPTKTKKTLCGACKIIQKQTDASV